MSCRYDDSECSVSSFSEQIFYLHPHLQICRTALSCSSVNQKDFAKCNTQTLKRGSNLHNLCLDTKPKIMCAFVHMDIFFNLYENCNSLIFSKLTSNYLMILTRPNFVATKFRALGKNYTHRIFIVEYCNNITLNYMAIASSTLNTL